jgi:hypothetical protein
VFFEAAQDHLEDAVEVMARADALGDLLQQCEAAHLRAHAPFELPGLP